MGATVLCNIIPSLNIGHCVLVYPIIFAEFFWLEKSQALPTQGERVTQGQEHWKLGIMGAT